MDAPLNARGFDVILVKEELKSTYQCPLCSFILRKPIQTERGERACAECYYELHDRNPGICPIDQEKIDIKKNTFFDRYLQRQVQELDCYCNNKPNTCPWQGKLRGVEAHLRSCLYVPMVCEKCRETIFKINKEEHDNEECPERILRCEYCHEELSGRMIKIHDQKCLKRPIKCPYQCGVSVRKENLRDHLLLHCQSLKTGKQCPYSIVGCTYQRSTSDSNSSDLLQHLVDDIHVHTGYLLHNFQKKVEENELLKKELLDLQKEIKSINNEPLPPVEKYIEKTNSLSKQIDGFNKEFQLTQKKHANYIKELEDILKDIGNSTKLSKLSNLEEEITTLYENYEEIEGLISRSKKSNISDYGDDVESELKSFSQKIESLESRNAIIDSNIVELKNNMDNLEGMSSDGDIIWRVPNIMLKMSEAKKGKNYTALHSPPCYSRKGGYKFCARLYLNGDGIGKDTHISLFIVIMRTEYDVLLPWPFQERVTFQLIHPHTRTFSVQESFIPDKNSSSFQKPVKEMNVAAGCPLFIRQEDLHNRNFIVDDCIYIRIAVGKVI